MPQPTSDTRIAVERSAIEDHGAFLRRDAQIAGMSKGQIDRRVRRGQWLSGPTRTTLVVAAQDAGPLTWLRAANLGLSALAWGSSALALHGLGQHPETPTIASPRRTRCSVYSTVAIADLSIIPSTRRLGIRTVTLESALASMAASLKRPGFEDIVDEALRQRLTTWSRLEASFERFALRGRKGSRLLHTIIADRSTDSVVPLSVWSREVATRLQRSGLPRPLMEHRVLDSRYGLIAQVDLAYVDNKVAIELDSVGFHLNRAAFETDRRRDANLARHGWRVLRFTWAQCADDWRWVTETIRAQIECA